MLCITLLCVQPILILSAYFLCHPYIPLSNLKNFSYIDSMYNIVVTNMTSTHLTTVSSTLNTISHPSIVLLFFNLYHSASSLQDGVTALLIASENGHEEVVRQLLQSGAKDMPDNVRMFNICML